MTEDEMVGWHRWHNGHEFEQTPGDSEGQGSLVCFSPWGSKESDMTERLNWLSQWPHPTISSSVIPFFSHLQSFPASGAYLMSQFFPSGSQSIGASPSASVLLMKFQGWFPLGLTGWISLQSKGLSRVFSNTTVGKYPMLILISDFSFWRLSWSLFLCIYF